MLQTERYKTRMRFTKTGSVRFVGHLDLMRFFQKAIRRAGLNVAYSKGFSPHQLMGFAAPLGVGATTDGDYMDVEFEPVRPEAGRDPAQESAGADSGQARAIMPDSYDVPPEMLMERLNGCLTDEIFVTAIWRMPEGFKNSMSLLETSAYMITAKTPEAFPVDVSNRFEEFLSQDEILVVKKTKKSEREIDLKPAILAHAFDRESFEQEIGEPLPALHPVYTGDSLFLKLPASSGNTVKPEQVMEAFYHYCHHNPEPWSYQIHRCQQWFSA